MREEETTFDSSTAQPKVYQLTEEALQNLIQAQMGNSSSSAPPSDHIFSRTEQFQSKAISLCDKIQRIRINPLSVAEKGGTARAAQPSTPSVNSHRNSGPSIIADGSVKSVQQSMHSVIPRQNCGPGVIAGGFLLLTQFHILCEPLESRIAKALSGFLRGYHIYFLRHCVRRRGG
ncbi:unnamed protein product [Haemonchus placei]|uniref:Uncharacterized protein n=1 Tax=Haemonchus placei TaxID=6290 RepID=A0A0N4W9A4_HAEPC|nr:unnamed protein product [Haemonchus placei]